VKQKPALLLFFIPLLAKIPFLGVGYGSEEDAWGHVQNILEMKEAGHYIMSRLPGHPVYEALLFLLWPIHNPWVYNGLSAVASSLAILALYKIAKHFQIKNAFWISLIFAFVPVLFLSGTYTIDYSLGLAFCLWSFWFLLKNKILASAVLLALAVGTRLTWALMFLPWLLQINNINGSGKDYLKFTSVFGVFLLLFYIPVFHQYGFSFFSTYALPYPPISKAIYKGSIGVWGLTGFFAVCVLILGSIKNRPSKTQWVWLLPILLYSILYIRLPEKSAFFIPVIPFLLLLVFSFQNSFNKYLLGALFLSGFILGINLTDPLRGATPKSYDLKKIISGQEVFLSVERGLFALEWEKRKNKIRSTEKFISILQNLKNKKSVVICGWWYAMIETSATAEKEIPKNIVLKYYLSDEEMRHYTKNGFELFYLPEQNEINDRKNNSNYTTENAQLLFY